MPIKLPPKPRPKNSKPSKFAHARERLNLADGPMLWAVSIGIAAIVLAWVADHTGGDRIGAVYILGGGAALIALVLNIVSRERA
ncbi:MAG: hypothetical protein P8Y53_01280 [Pseudolabrys sp.]|jgi:hypothetical protein